MQHRARLCGALLLFCLALAACTTPDPRASAQEACSDMRAVSARLNLGSSDIASSVKAAQSSATRALVEDELHFQQLAVLINGFPKVVGANVASSVAIRMRQISAECGALGFTWQREPVAAG